MGRKFSDPIHPGEILDDELKEIGMNGAELAERLNVPANRVYQILKGKRSITADTAMRLGQFFGTGPEIWVNLQKSYELDVVRRMEGKDIKSITPYQQAGVHTII